MPRWRWCVLVLGLSFSLRPIWPQELTAPDSAPAADSSSSSSRDTENRPSDTVNPVLAASPRLDLTERCREHLAAKSECSEHWRKMFEQSFAFLGIQHGINIAKSSDTRYQLTHGNLLHKYWDAIHAARFGHWDDGDPNFVNYVGHPMMGATVDFIYIQNDPKAAALQFGGSRLYWMSRMRAMAWNAFYSAQWEVGPISEAAIGNEGLEHYISERTGKWTNGAGVVDFVVTPTIGTGWAVGEDILDQQIVRRLERVSTRGPWLFGISFLNPDRSLANMLRGKAPWYRDSRRVKMGAPVLIEK